MTRYKHCGSAVTLPTYPAWSFGGKHHAGDLPPGPGTAKYPGAADRWEAGTAVFGGPPGATERPWQYSSAPYSGGQYLKPDYLSQNPKGPAWSFGQRPGKPDSGSPGVGAYSPNTNTFNFPRQQHSVWGPPPRPRPPSAPHRAPPLFEEDRRRAKPLSALPGTTFKGKFPPARPTDGPGPAYNPCCGGHCCDMCQKYNGVSFGIRHHQHVEPPTPAPHHYHTGCSSLGAAAAGCQSGEDGSLHGTYHAPTRRDHAYAAGIRP